ncbi:general secretion pathway protein GspB [Acidovorax sp. A1169]|uniref:general secretion pathway protein GspB n=1 Tax=Acidovorax sp. A1169 TaxID=3059524 RepID=UPI002737E643|nr:general secretion pathway protein GspB [Acidovorax sp. A1169]MDP4074852.1 general secretion pathway protein GspB [Acidovorax sp. A1169]
MSYILDALRRAEAERGRGAVPGIHTQAMPATSASPGADRAGSANLLVIGSAVVAVAALAAGGTWWVMQRGVPASGVVVASTPQPPVSVAPVAPPATAVAPPAMPAPPAPVASPPITPARVEPRPVAPLRLAEPVREKPAGVAAPARPRDAEVQREPAARAQPPLAAAPAVAAAPAAAPPNGPVFAQNDLPPSVREQLPALQVTGATYSSNPAHRMAIVNGQVLQEGDQAAPGLKLERIEQGRTVWSFRGYRYAVAPQ